MHAGVGRQRERAKYAVACALVSRRTSLLAPRHDAPPLVCIAKLSPQNYNHPRDSIGFLGPSRSIACFRPGSPNPIIFHVRESFVRVDHPQAELEIIVSVPFDENTLIARLADRHDCLVVDPGLEPEKILDFLEPRQLEPAAILNTHGHSDHIAGNAALKERWPDAPLVIGHGDEEKLTDPRKNLSAAFGLSLVSPPADQLLREGEPFAAAGFELTVREIPGHSAGHIVLIWEAHPPAVVFGGDVLFAGSIGRTDFPDGSLEALTSGIHTKLFTLPDDTLVLPGHGPVTTIGREKATNPFVGAPAGYEL
ncbi:MAG: MBL fold metallo-hydrolase [Planctomycetota bacterium]|nr:MAG: MBL fold metallo-hydrolase [Planctomycetota bacterium]REJ88098.1 MAG: MBL fold metallo-hydrolase [Planctomycetota bacterium]